ncbi:HAD family hydrolase [Streptomyces sp. NPDC102467]|uniref:HAD family hydrolase n=1 Tax=Streptomyces sp. NPDC102467 TaxID=3366179 RepID=UPI0038278FF3
MARPVLEALRRHAPHAAIAAEVPGTGYLVTVPFPADRLRGRQTLSTLEEMLASPVVRVAARDPEATAEDFHALTRRLHIRGASCSVGFEAWLDLGPLGVSKASGLTTAATMLDVTADQALAIGDGYNSREMLTWAGRGVAMGHAPAALCAVADHTTLSITEDGAAIEFEWWFPTDRATPNHWETAPSPASQGPWQPSAIDTTALPPTARVSARFTDGFSAERERHLDQRA